MKRKKRRDPGTWVLLVRAFGWGSRTWWNAAVYDAREDPFAGGVEASRAAALRAALGEAFERRGAPACVRVEREVMESGEIDGLVTVELVGPEQEELIERFAREVEDGDPDFDLELDAAEIFADFVAIAGRALETLEAEDARRLARVRARGGPSWFAMVSGGATPAVIVSELDDAAALHAALTTGVVPPVRAIAVHFRDADEVAPDMPAAMRDGGWHHARMPCVTAIRDGRIVEAVDDDLAELTDVLELLFDEQGYEDVDVEWQGPAAEPPRVIN